MPILSYEQVLWDRLGELRRQLDAVREALSDYKPPFREVKIHVRLQQIEQQLDAAHAALSRATPDLDAAEPRLVEARKSLDELSHVVAVLCRRLELFTGIWAAALLVGCGLASLGLWSSVAAPPRWLTPFLGQEDVTHWLKLRALLFTAVGGVAGTSLNLGKILFVAIPARTFDRRSTLWYCLAPVFGSALAVAGALLLHANLLGGSSLHSGEMDYPPTAAAFIFGLVIGFVPTALHERLQSVVKAFFGTEDVSAPSVGMPVVTLIDGHLDISASVVANASARVTAVSATIQTGAGAFRADLGRGSDYRWTGRAPIPAALASQPSATVVVEAQDELRKTGRSQPVTVTLASGGSPLPTPDGAPPPPQPTPASPNPQAPPPGTPSQDQIDI